MQNGLTLLNVPSFWQLVATGVVVILAVFVDQATRKRQ
jgi:ribose transport system permease protein